MNLKLAEAINFASVAHEGQKRADKQTPFISHPLAVGMILSTYGYSEAVIIAGILHDVVEDTKFTADEIGEKFGEEIKNIVLGVTEDKSITNRIERFEKYLQTVANASKESKAVCTADMLHNRLSVVIELKKGFKIWEALHTTKEAYIENTEKRLSIVENDVNPELIHKVRELLEVIRKN